MTIGDPISDLLTRIRNGAMARKRFVEIKSSKMVVSVVKILKEQGFIEGFLVKEEKPQGLVRIYLKYGEGRKPIVQGLKRVSKPSRRRYVGYKAIPRIRGGMGISVMSTSMGMMVGAEAREKQVGGEVVCYVW